MIICKNTTIDLCVIPSNGLELLEFFFCNRTTTITGLFHHSIGHGKGVVYAYMCAMVRILEIQRCCTTKTNIIAASIVLTNVDDKAIGIYGSFGIK